MKYTQPTLFQPTPEEFKKVDIELLTPTEKIDFKQPPREKKRGMSF